MAGYGGRLLGTVLETMTEMAGRLVFSPFVPTLITDLGVSASAAGFSLTVMWSWSANSVSRGVPSETLTRKTVLVASLLVLLVDGAVFLIADGLVTLLLATAVFGLGAGLWNPTVLLALSDYFRARRIQAFAIVTASVNLDGILTAGLAVLALFFGNWRLAFVPVVGLLCLRLALTH